jgi:oxygen-independent coproporphyrinogen-3 oxidase
MSGLYIHIPFCSQACHYCDFHFSTDNRNRSALITGLCREIELQTEYLSSNPLETIYFGGGTPSILSQEEFALIQEHIRRNFSVHEKAEITLEANPEDLSIEKLKFFSEQGINRLSIGVQSLDDETLIRLNRVHLSGEALASISRARIAGFKNISIDLIFGIPGRSIAILENDIRKILELKPEHISIYGLTIEPKTVFGIQHKRGNFIPVSDDQQADEFELISDQLDQSGYRQYEVSNFSLPGFESVHNSNYWKQKHYLGIGPGAHSFNGFSRQFNVLNNALYEKSIAGNKIPFEREILTRSNKINEYIMTSLRTAEGCNLEKLMLEHNFDLLKMHQSYIENLLATDKATMDGSQLRLNRLGRLIADKISGDLFTD